MRRLAHPLSLVFLGPPVLLMAVAAWFLAHRVLTAANDRLVEAALNTLREQYQLEVKVAGVQADLFTGMLTAMDVEVWDQGGPLVLRVEKVSAVFPGVRARRLFARIEAERGVAWLSRNEAGEFEVLERLLRREPEAEPLEFPFDVRVRDFAVRYEDRSGDLPEHALADGVTASVQVIGSEGRFTVQTVVQDAGEVYARGRWEENGGSVRFSAEKLDVPEALRAVRSRFDMEELRPVRVMSATAGGVGAVAWGNDAVDWIASGKGQGHGLQYNQYRFDGQNLYFSAAPERVRVTGRVESRGARAEALVVVAPSHEKPEIFVSAAAEGPAAERFWDFTGQAGAPLVTGPFTADVVVAGPVSDLGFRGRWSVGRARWDEYAAQDLSGYVSGRAGGKVQVRRIRGTLHGADLEADAQYDMESGRTLVGAAAIGLDLSALDPLTEQGLHGAADAVAIFEGTTDDPYLVVNVSVPHLKADRKLLEDKEPWRGDLGAVDARAVWAGKDVTVPLVRLSGDLGRLQARGAYDPDAPRMDFRFDATGVLLDALQPTLDLGGTAFAAGTLSGPVGDLLLDLRTEVFTPSYQRHEVALASARLAYQSGRLTIMDGNVRQGAASADIGGAVLLAGAGPVLDLEVGVTGLDPRQVLEELDYDLPVRGFVSASGSVTGQIDSLSAVGTVTSPEVYLDKIPLDDLTAQVAYEGGAATVTGFHARALEGNLSGEGYLDTDGRIGGGVTARDVPLSIFNSYIDPAIPLSGLLTASLGITGTTDEPHVSALGELADVSISGLDMGSGSAEAALGGGVLTGQASVGDTNRDLAVHVNSFELESHRFDASVDASAEIEDLRRLARRLAPNLDPAVWRYARKPEGILRLSAEGTGTPEDYSIPFTLASEDLSFLEDPAGTLTASGSVQADLCRFDEIKWDISGGRVVASGDLRPSGEINGSVEVQNFDVHVLEPFAPALQGVRGFVDATAVAQGRTKAPDIDLSLTLTDFGRGELRVDSASFSRVSVREGAIETDGAVLQKEGYVARLSGRFPFSYDPFGVPEGEPIFAELTIPPQDLDGLEVFLPMLDAERTSGIIRGPEPDSPITVVVSGDIADPRYTGEVVVEGDSFALQDYDEELRDIRGALRLEDNTVSIPRFDAATASGGSLHAEASTNIVDGLDSPVSGELAIDGLTVRQRAREGRPGFVASLDGAVTAGGTLRHPDLSGELLLRSADLPLPSAWAAEEEAGPPAIEPVFDVTLNIAPDTWVRSSLLDARVRGTARLQRRLTSPLVTASIEVLEGKVQLPSTRLILQEGGTVNVTYDGQAGREAYAAALVDLKARTNLTAAGPLGSPVTYRIDLTITGSLLDEGALQMHASSSPPDLTEQQIFALLGHQGFLESFSGGDVGRAFQDELKDILGGAVLPTLFEAIDPALAQRIGLESFALTYNRYEALTLNISKELFSGMSLYYRRGLRGTEQPFEVKLLWRLPIPERMSGSFNLGWSYDEQREHRISIEWGLRF